MYSNSSIQPKARTLSGTTTSGSVVLGVKAMKMYSTFSKAPDPGPHHQIILYHIPSAKCRLCILRPQLTRLYIYIYIYIYIYNKGYAHVHSILYSTLQVSLCVWFYKWIYILVLIYIHTYLYTHTRTQTHTQRHTRNPVCLTIYP